MNAGKFSHAHHDGLIARACASNPTLQTRSFWDALATAAADPVVGDGSAKSHRENLAELRDAAGVCALPDAWAIDAELFSVVIWEVCNTTRVADAVAKWKDLALVLDAYGAWSVDVVTVDAHGVCHAMAGVVPVVWMVDTPCPVEAFSPSAAALIAVRRDIAEGRYSPTAPVVHGLTQALDSALAAAPTKARTA
jgi:hypothetical protein